MGLVVRGTHTGREYDLSEPVDTEIEAGAIKRREERNGHYSDIHVVDLDKFEEDGFRALPRHEQEAAAAKGHPVAARILGQSAAPVKAEESGEDLRAEIERLKAELAERNSPQGETSGEGNSKGGGPFDSDSEDSGKSGSKSRASRGKASE